MCIKLGNKSLRISFTFAVFFAVAANVTGGTSVLLSFLFSLIHELVHLCFLHLCGIKKAEIVLLPAAVKINCQGLNLLYYKKMVLCTLSAPVFNLVTGAVFSVFYHFYPSENIKICVLINFILGAINLFPMSFLDGGRALTAVLCKKYSEEKVHFIMKRLSAISLIFLFAVFFIGCILGSVQLFLLIFCVYCLIGTVCDKL